MRKTFLTLIHEINSVFQHLKFDWASPNGVILLRPLILPRHPTGKLKLPALYLDEPNPNTRITVVDGNTHSFAFSFGEFLQKIWLKFAANWDGNYSMYSSSLSKPGLYFTHNATWPSSLAEDSDQFRSDLYCPTGGNFFLQPGSIKHKNMKH